MIRRATAFALLVLLGLGRASAARTGEPIALHVAACTSIDVAALARHLDIELRSGEPNSPARATAVSIGCSGRRALVRVRLSGGAGRASRALDLEATPIEARARLVALAVAELVSEGGEARPRLRATIPTEAPHEDPMLERILSTSLVASMFLSVTAIALPKKESEVSAPQTALTRPQPRSDGAHPAVHADDLLGPVGERVRAVTDSQIKVMRRLLDNTADADADKPELHFQLGELYAEQQRFFSWKARDLDGKPAARAQQADYERREREATLAAVREYLVVADHPDRFGDYKRMDEVLFYLAYLLNQVKKEEAARGYLKRLIKDHPTSRFIPDALLAFAEHFFDQAQLENALVFYDKVLEYPGSRLYGYALYKKGWCAYNLGDFKRAIALFVQVTELAAKSPAGDRLQLGREARRDVVRTYAQLGTAERAWPFFVRVGGANADAMLEQLAELFLGQGKFGDTARVYRQLIAHAPASPRVCLWQGEVVKATLGETGARADAATVKELERLDALVALGTDAGCRETASALERELGPVWHKEAQTTGVTRSYELAHAVYQLFLRRFHDEPQALAMTFYDGELLYKLGRYCEAAPRYSEVVHRDPQPKAKYLREAAWAAVLSSRTCLGIDEVPKISDGPPTGGPSALAPRPVPEPWQKMFVAFDDYLRYVPDGAERIAVQYRKARALYELNRFDEAIPLFRELVEKHPQSELAVYAADLVFDSYAVQKRVHELSAAVDAYCPLRELERAPGFARRCRVIRSAIDRQRAEELERAGSYREAAEAYLRLAQSFPDDARLDEVLYDAAIDFQRAKVIGFAILAFQELIARRPESPLAKKSIYMVGRNFQDIAEFDHAAENYEAFATRWPGERDASTALQRASFFRRALGHYERALEDTRTYLRNYAGRPEMIDAAAGVAFGEAQIYEQRREWDKLELRLQSYLRELGGRGGIDRQIIAHVKLGELSWRQSCPVAGVQGACVEVKRTQRERHDRCGRGVETIVIARRPQLVARAMTELAQALKLYAGGAASARVTGRDEAERSARAAELAWHAAQARMLQGDLAYESFLGMSIPPGLDFTRPRDKRVLAAWLEKKSRALESARRIYSGVIQLRQTHWAIAAAARVGQLFQGYAAQLLTTPIPKTPPAPAGLEPRKWAELFRNAYCDAFGDQITLLEDRAVDALGQCLHKSTELSWFNEWSGLCEAELNQLRPIEYPLASEVRAEPGYVAAVTDRMSVQPLDR